MASIRKRRNSYSVVYSYINEKGEKKQKRESYPTYEEAHKRRAEVEFKQDSGTFISPNKRTVAEFLEDFVRLYGEKRWGLSMYMSNTGLIRNYINPIIGHMELQNVTTLEADRLIQRLLKTSPVNSPANRKKGDRISTTQIEKIYKILRCAFSQAVRWELIAKNPFAYTILPKVERKKREIWTADMIRIALDHCEDPVLYLAINLAFACSLRVGEITGLTWDCVNIRDEDIAADNASVFIEKELSRVSVKAMQVLEQRDIIKVFPPVFRPSGRPKEPTTLLVLKKPKTETSVRRVWLPRTLAYILREWKAAQEKNKVLLGSDYLDEGFVIAQANGRPCEHKIIEVAFNRLKEKAGLPNVVFHSLRHSSTTYKLKLNHGDLKATQGDTGHAQVDMITQIYAHILDEDRKINAQRFEEAFYFKPDLRQVQAPQETAPKVADLASIIQQLQQSPELAAVLREILVK